MNMDFDIQELYDIKTAIQDGIEKCDTMIADCKHYKFDNELVQVWIDKRERLNKSLDKFAYPLSLVSKAL